LEDERIKLKLQIRELVKTSGHRGYIIQCLILCSAVYLLLIKLTCKVNWLLWKWKCCKWYFSRHSVSTICILSYSSAFLLETALNCDRLLSVDPHRNYHP